MAVARTLAVALNGVDGAVVEVEADLANGLPAFTIIGLPDTALGEAKDRVRAAAQNNHIAKIGLQAQHFDAFVCQN